METIVLNIKGNEKHDFFASAGMWKDKNIDAKELRAKAWNRVK